METLQARTVGQILDLSIRLSLRRFWFYYPMSAVAAVTGTIIPQLLPRLFIGGDMGPSSAILLLVAMLAFMVLLIWMYGVFGGATIYALGKEAIGGRATIRESLRTGLKCSFSVAMTEFTTMLGAVFCLVGILFTASHFWAASPAVVLERAPASKALARSSSLTADRRGPLIGLFCIVTILSTLLTGPFVWPLGFTHGEADIMHMGRGWSAVTFWMFWFGLLLSAALQIPVRAAQVLFYLDLRVRKEGLDLALAAQKKESAPAAEPAP